MILSIVLAVLIIGLVWLIGAFVAGEVYGDKAELVTRIITYTLIDTTLVVSPIIGYSCENAEVEKDYYGYLAVKQTYELAVADEKLTGLERLEITKTVMEQNELLARKKVDMDKWYSFAITEENKQLILSLEPIV